MRSVFWVADRSQNVLPLSGPTLLANRSGTLKDPVSRAFAAACMLAISPATLAIAQTAKSSDLEPLVVETEKKKKKPVSAAKSTPPKQAKQAPPAPPPSQSPPTPQQLSAEQLANIAAGNGAATPGGNPYANPEAPYMVERSASGKLTQPLLNTPKTVTTIPKEVIEDKGARDLRDLARETPGLTIGSAEGGNSYGAFAIRGFKANNDIFVDSIRNPGNIIPDVFSVEQVEIYKGPSGGIAGRSTIGGAVNIISKQPDLNWNFGEINTMVGTDSTVRTTLDLNEVITHDFAVRANVMYDQHDVAGRDFADSERWGGLISATAKPTSDVFVTLDYYRYRNDATPDWGVPVIRSAVPSLPTIQPHVPVTESGVPRDTWFGEKDLDFFKESADIGTAVVAAKLADGLTLTNRSRVGESSLNYIATSVEGLTYHHPNRDQDAHIYANQTELNAKFSTGPFYHNAVAGVEFTREEINRLGYALSPNTAPVPIVDGMLVTDPFRHDTLVLRKGKTYDATIDTVGTYLLDTVHLSEQWIVNGGFRFDNFSRDQVGGPGTNVPGSAAANTAIATNTASVSDLLFSWNAGIVYKPIPISSFYVAYGTSESPVGSELDSTGAQYNGISATLVDVPPQEARSIEVGTKWELFDRRLLATAALFQTNVDHARTNDNVTATDDTNAFAGKYRVRGIELSAAGNITKDWSVYGGLVLLNTEVLGSSNPQDIGRRLANIPLTQFSLLSKYQLTDDLAVGGTATYSGEVYGGHLAANEANNHTVAWWRFDAFAEYELSKNWEIEVTGLNLTNELYYDAIYQAPDNPPGGTFAFVAPGRAGYLTVKYKF
jgi:catecholate siderophore receptor